MKNYCQRHGFTGFLVDVDCDGCVDLVTKDEKEKIKDGSEKRLIEQNGRGAGDCFG